VGLLIPNFSYEKKFKDLPPLGKKSVLGWMAFIGCVIIFQWMENNNFFGLF
ncbi:uncharacterized protein METZ01_LOCUS306340, partial [marine metagenome]